MHKISCTCVKQQLKRQDKKIWGKTFLNCNNIQEVIPRRRIELNIENKYVKYSTDKRDKKVSLKP